MTSHNPADNSTDGHAGASKEIGRSGVFVPVMGNGTQAWGDKRFGFGSAHGRDGLYAIETYGK